MVIFGLIDAFPAAGVGAYAEGSPDDMARPGGGMCMGCCMCLVGWLGLRGRVIWFGVNSGSDRIPGMRSSPLGSPNLKVGIWNGSSNSSGLNSGVALGSGSELDAGGVLDLRRGLNPQTALTLEPGGGLTLGRATVG